MAVFGWLVAGVDFFERKVLLADVGWLVLVLCEREILLAGCSEDEAIRVKINRSVKRQHGPIKSFSKNK